MLNHTLFAVTIHSFLITGKITHDGVGLFVKDDTDYIDCPDLSVFIPFVFESVFIMIKPSNVTVGVIYRTPDSNINKFLLQYEKTLQLLHNLNHRYILLGDFNSNLPNFNEDSQVTEFANLTL